MQAYTAKNSVDLLTPSQTKKQAPKNDSGKNGNGGDFLSMVLDAAASKANVGEKITQKDVKEIVKSVSMQREQQDKELNDSMAKISSQLDEKLDEDTKNELYENANFMQLLQVLEILNGDEKVSKFPNFTDKIANFLSVPENVKELSEVKSVKEFIDLAKKFDLGLEKISISTQDVAKLEDTFKNLGKKEFFTPVATKPQNFYSQNLKKEVEQTINQSQAKEPPKLNELLQEVAKEPAPKAKQEQAEQTNVKEVITQASTQKVKEELTKEKPQTAQMQNFTPKSVENGEKTQKAPTLESLLYPEREQNAQEGMEQNSGESKGDNELNSMIKDISRSAQHQMQNKAQVRETLSNFSETLRDQIQSYQPPITRFNITLNPLNLGEVEITMVNRGNNLHVNFNSNTATMNLFLQNQAEFKNSLVNMGFTELEMNFSDQNAKRDNNQQSNKRYAQDQQNDDEAAQAEQNLLELVIPRYI